MIWVCDNHVKDGVKVLRAPHIKATAYHTICLFCKHSAVYELYYDLKNIGLKKTN